MSTDEEKIAAYVRAEFEPKIVSLAKAAMRVVACVEETPPTVKGECTFTLDDPDFPEFDLKLEDLMNLVTRRKIGYAMSYAKDGKRVYTVYLAATPEERLLELQHKRTALEAEIAETEACVRATKAGRAAEQPESN